MSLDVEILEVGLTHIFLRSRSHSSVFSTQQVGLMWADAYHSYARIGRAADLGIPRSTKEVISSSIAGVSFVTELSAGIASYWIGSSWLPVNGNSYITLSSFGLETFLLPAFAENRTSSASAESASKRIAMALHIYTTSMVTVAATNLSTGVTMIVKIV